MTEAAPIKPVCGVCGAEVTDDFADPPTFSLQPAGDRRLRPVLSKPIRMDPETGAVCWCATTREVTK